MEYKNNIFVTVASAVVSIVGMLMAYISFYLMAKGKLLYLFWYKMDDFPVQNYPKKLGPSDKMDLDFWIFLEGKIYLVA